MADRKTQIIATIGPATLDSGIFKKLVDEGVGIVRINSSYGDYSQYDTILGNIKNLGSPVKVLYDIKGEEKLDFFEKNCLSWVAVSFAESTQQLDKIKARFPDAFIISKIETEAGVENFDEILAASNGVMIARGDLSVAETVEKVPPLQKTLSRQVKVGGRYLITATEMLLSMVEKPEPTIAEVSDVANAVFDGSDAVMLSEETATGKYPIDAVRIMRKTIEQAENWFRNSENQ